MLRVSWRRGSAPLRRAFAVAPGIALEGLDLASIPPSRMVTFSIVAHVDHGKSSLSQKLLERAGNVAVERGVGVGALDTLTVEVERGITVKAVTATMPHAGADGEVYLVNLVDTPGHADFADEVSRSLAACDGALLLVDAAQGVEAQTLKWRARPRTRACRSSRRAARSTSRRRRRSTSPSRSRSSAWSTIRRPCSGCPPRPARASTPSCRRSSPPSPATGRTGGASPCAAASSTAATTCGAAS